MMQKKNFLVTLISTLLCLMSIHPVNGVNAQGIKVENPFVINVDYANFRYDEKNAYLEIYYALYPGLVSYVSSNGGSRGTVLLTTMIREKGSKKVVVERSASHPMFIKDSEDPFLNSTYVMQAGFSLPSGEYELEIVGIDSIKSHRMDRLTLPISLVPFPEKGAISDLELCSNITTSDDKSDPFYKNTLVVVPNPTLVFGVMNHPVIFLYAELYNLDPAREYSVRTVVKDAAGKITKDVTKKKTYGAKNSVEVSTHNISSMPSGKYSISVQMGSTDGQIISSSEKVFFANNPHVPQISVAAVELKSSEMAGLSADELQEEFKMAQYVATSQEIKMFSQFTSEDGRREFLAKFWIDVEAGSGGRRAINRNEYLRRVGIANTRYRVLNRDGWRTDRGRVFILYGEPDHIERTASSESTKPHEAWKYYQIENGVDFVFVDRSGFGEYILVHSTKRGELYDDQWQRFL